MLSQIAGVPAHPLFVHVTVVAVPLAALIGLLVLAGRPRRWLGVLSPVIGLIALIST